MKRMAGILILLILILGGVAVALWLLPTLGMRNLGDIRFGQYEGLELVCHVDKWGDESYTVTDATGKRKFNIPLRNCIIDTRFRDGKLRFRENGTNREGYIDRKGAIVFLNEISSSDKAHENRGSTIQTSNKASSNTKKESPDNKQQNETLDLRKITRDNPFYKEAAKVLSGKLDEDDAERRRMILAYCEHLRTAYTTKDIDFLKQVFSEQALIIVGNVVKAKQDNVDRYLPADRVTYILRTKKEYIARLTSAFAANKQIDVQFTDFHVMRHPTAKGIYGVTMRQKYSSDKYSDDGYLFILWDFRDQSMPMILVRTWQPAESISEDNEVVNIRDFNLE